MHVLHVPMCVSGFWGSEVDGCLPQSLFMLYFETASLIEPGFYQFV